MSGRAPNYAKHLPPSPGVPRVLAVDGQSAEALQGVAEVSRAAADGQVFDAIAGLVHPEDVSFYERLLRPGGRLIFCYPASKELLLAALEDANLIHCLVEPTERGQLYRGEKPPPGRSVERVQLLGEASPTDTLPKFVHVLIVQSPNKPAWKMEAGEKIEWRAVTAVGENSGQPVMLAFSSLVKAVAFMQRAVLANIAPAVNKVAKFEVRTAATWQVSLALNPVFDDWQDAAFAATTLVDPAAAIVGEE